MDTWVFTYIYVCVGIFLLTIIKSATRPTPLSYLYTHCIISSTIKIGKIPYYGLTMDRPHLDPLVEHLKNPCEQESSDGDEGNHKEGIDFQVFEKNSAATSIRIACLRS